MQFKKKLAVAVMAATLAIGTTAFAASNIITVWTGHSSGIPEYQTLPTEQQCLEDVGYVPVLIDTFANGYSFDNGSVVHNTLKDAEGNSVEQFDSLTFRYAKDGDMAYLSQEKFTSPMEQSGEVVSTVEEVNIYYSGYTNKVVPPDYQMTEEDKQAEANGDLVFSYGSQEVEIIEVHSVSWMEEDIHYNLMQLDGQLSAEELTEMAAEIIEK